MLKHIQIIIPALLLIVAPQLLNAQVYVSKLVENTVLVGPENTQPINTDVASNYVDKINQYAHQLNELHIENEQLISQLENEHSNQKKTKKALSKAHKMASKINNELVIAKDFLDMWKQLESNKKSNAEFVQLTANQDVCYEIITESGNYNPNEYEVRPVKNENTFLHKESIPVTFTTEKTEWVQERNTQKTSNSTSCSSSCGNSSSVLHSLKSTKASCKFKQYKGITYNENTCPVGFTYSKEEKACVKYEKLATAQTQEYEVIRVKDNQILEIKNWIKTDCKQSTLVNLDLEP